MVSENASTKNQVGDETRENTFERVGKELADLKFALDVSTIVFFTDQTGKITYVNEKFCEISKYSREDVLGQNPRIFNTGFHAKEFIKNLWATITEGRVWRGEFRNRTKDGLIFWVEMTIVPFLDETGKPYQYAAVSHDITERHRLEESLQQNLERLRANEEEIRARNEELQAAKEEFREQNSQFESSRELFAKAFSASPDVLVISRLKDGIIIEVNESWEKLFGYSREQVLGKSSLMMKLFVDPASRSRAAEILEKEGKVREFETSIRNASGEERVVLLSVERLETGGEERLLTIIRDITRRKKNEAEIRRRERDLNLAQSAAHLGSWRWDLRSDRFYWSEELYRIFGVEPAGFTPSNAAASQMIHPEDRTRYAEFVGILLTGKKIESFELRIIRPSKEQRVVLASGFEIEFDEGVPVSLFGTFLDVTDRKRAEEQIQKQAEMLDHTYDAIFAWNPEKGITYWNKSAEKLYGFTRREAFGHAPRNLLKTVYPSSFDKFFGRLEEKKRWEGELLHTNKAGRQFTVESRLVLLTKNLGEPLILETTHDITLRKEAEDRIRQQASLLDQTRDAVMVCDLGFQILFWNKGAEDFYGWKSENVIGKKIADVIYHDDRESFENVVLALEKSDEWQSETVHHTKDGEKITVVSRWKRIRNEENQPDYFLIVDSDITEIKRTEEQLFRAQRMESIGTLAGGIAHDLNNVLSPIMMSVDMLRADEEADEETESKSEPWLSIIKESALRGSNLIKQVLVFARGATGERVEIDLRHLAMDLIKILNETFPKNITVNYEIQPELSLVSADPTQIHQILMNLALNARDAMPMGGIVNITVQNVILDEVATRVNIDAEPGNYVLVMVEDTGVGMSEEVLKRIWDPFYTTKETGKGTGLGLSTVMSILKSHHGFINVSSELQKGTKISVFLPATASETAVAENTQTAQIPQGKGELIMVVDDEVNIRKVTAATLNKYGYRTLDAEDSTAAVAFFAQRFEEIDLVLTDMAMPFMDGAFLIRVLRKLKPEIKVIAVSGLVDQQKVDFKELKTDAFLLKPFSAETLLATVAAVFGGENKISFKGGLPSKTSST